ncbi:MAG: hypothetical protein V4735_07045 [Pseudomonadota bacterium]
MTDKKIDATCAERAKELGGYIGTAAGAGAGAVAGGIPVAGNILGVIAGAGVGGTVVASATPKGDDEVQASMNMAGLAITGAAAGIAGGFLPVVPVAIVGAGIGKAAGEFIGDKISGLICENAGAEALTASAAQTPKAAKPVAKGGIAGL